MEETSQGSQIAKQKDLNFRIVDTSQQVMNLSMEAFRLYQTKSTFLLSPANS